MYFSIYGWIYETLFSDIFFNGVCMSICSVTSCEDKPMIKPWHLFLFHDWPPLERTHIGLEVCHKHVSYLWPQAGVVDLFEDKPADS